MIRSNLKYARRTWTRKKSEKQNLLVSGRKILREIMGPTKNRMENGESKQLNIPNN